MVLVKKGLTTYETTYLVEFFVELAELGGLAHDVLVDHKRGLDLFIPTFSEEVEGVGDECLV